MQTVTLAVTFAPEALFPAHEFVCESRAVERELVLGGTVDDGVETVLSHVAGDRAAYESALAGREGTVAVETSADDGDGFLAYVATRLDGTGRGLADAFWHETVVTLFPVEVRPDRTMRLRLVGAADAVWETVEALPAGVDAEVVRVRDGAAVDAAGRTRGRLTARQRDAVAAARAVGYYEVPREGGLVAVAGRLSCSTSTASALLRRAEARLVDAALDE